MKSISYTDFEKNTAGFIDEVEKGETIILLRRGKPVVEIVPITGEKEKTAAWKKPGVHLKMQGGDLSSAILEERECET
jgi:prevent-host-death family protein